MRVHLGSKVNKKAFYGKKNKNKNICEALLLAIKNT